MVCNNSKFVQNYWNISQYVQIGLCSFNWPLIWILANILLAQDSGSGSGGGGDENIGGGGGGGGGTFAYFFCVIMRGFFRALDRGERASNAGGRSPR